jgi:hypothetical protein
MGTDSKGAWRYGRGRAVSVTVLLAILVSSAALAQRGGRFGLPTREQLENPPYNGRFTFSRLRYGAGMFGRGMSSAWNHDYPQADMHLPLILDALTALQPNLHVSNIFDLEDPEIFKNPVLYMWEPGFWRISAAGADNLRKYMLKGGFVIFDDFEADQWFNFEAEFRRALPDAEFIELDASHPIFHSFFEMNQVDVPHPTVRVEPIYYGVFKDNDRNGRMMALINYNNDVAEYWEWSGQGRFPVDTTNDAYKLGVNYMIYALTH